MLPPSSANTSISPTPAAFAAQVWRWLRWPLGAVVVLLLLASVALHFLDPWLRKKLEQQVVQQTRGQYQLRVGELHTSLWQRAIRLENIHLRPAAQVADTLPRLRLDAARLHLTGIGLLALLRRGTVPIDSVVLDSARLEVMMLARQPGKKANLPLHQRLPFGLEGLEIGYAGLQHVQAVYGPARRPTALVAQANLAAHDLLISASGAADTQRLAYAAGWQLALAKATAERQGHRIVLGKLQFSTDNSRLTLDSLRIQPLAALQVPPAQPRINLILPHLLLSGWQVAALQHQHHFQADSLLIQAPRLTFTPPAKPSNSGLADLKPYLSCIDLATLLIQDGYVRGAGLKAAPEVQGIQVAGTAIHVDSSATLDAQHILYAKSWEVTLGPTQAQAADYKLALSKLHLSTKAGTLTLDAIRIRPPAPGQGQPGAVRVDLALPRLALAGWQPSLLQQQRHLQAQSLLLAGARLTFTPPKKAPPPVWKLLAAYLRRTDLAELHIRQAELHIGGLRHLPDAYNINVTGNALRIDSAAAHDERRIAYARRWQAHTGLITAPFDPPFYRAKIQELHLDTDAKSLHLNKLTLTPALSPVGMNLHKGYQAPAVTVQMAALAATGFDFAALAQRGQVRMTTLTVQTPVIRLASDGRGPINPNMSKVSPELLRQLPMLVDVRQLDFQNGSINSWYRSPLTAVPGTMRLTRFNATFRNFSNDPRRQSAATPLTGHATAYLQNRCRMEAWASIPLLDPQGRHRLWGTFGPSPFAILNSMTEPTRLVRFKSGDVRRIRFDLQADKKQVTGTMRAEYSGLQLNLLGYQEEEKTVKRTLFSRVKSKAANVLVIRDQNPRKRGELVPGEMTSRREPRFSVFTLWRQGVVSGLLHSVGIPQPLAQKLSEAKDEAPLPK